MKIEMGESLIYSWLRHVKLCQMVQTNWKISSQWPILHQEKLQEIMTITSEVFEKECGYHIFKKNASLSQIIHQGECDLVGIASDAVGFKFCAVDVAFHENGLQYGSRAETVCKILSKCIRTAMCLYGYMDVRVGEIIFASPKIHRAVMNDVTPCIDMMSKAFVNLGFDFTFRIIANDEFNQEILQPVLALSGDVADTSELFLRSYQMTKLFFKGGVK